jgi:hypothetical protein
MADPKTVPMGMTQPKSVRASRASPSALIAGRVGRVWLSARYWAVAASSHGSIWAAT